MICEGIEQGKSIALKNKVISTSSVLWFRVFNQTFYVLQKKKAIKIG